MGSEIFQAQSYSHPGMEGVTVFPVGGDRPERGKEQQVLVCVAPNQRIPLHSHDTDAQMFIVDGGGFVCSEDPASDGREVGVGHCVFFERMKMHGFRAGSRGMKFVSTNGGIVDEGGDWDVSFKAA